MKFLMFIAVGLAQAGYEIVRNILSYLEQEKGGGGASEVKLVKRPAAFDVVWLCFCPGVLKLRLGYSVVF